jgi:hypothetical protein
MKTLVIVWLALAAAVLWWTPHQTGGFATRWPQLPPAMSRDLLDRARKASERPSWCMWVIGPDTPCRIS